MVPRGSEVDEVGEVLQLFEHEIKWLSKLQVLRVGKN